MEERLIVSTVLSVWFIQSNVKTVSGHKRCWCSFFQMDFLMLWAPHTHTKNLIIFHFIVPVADSLPWLHATKGNWEKYFFHHSDDLALYYCPISAFHFLFFSSPLWSVFCCVSRLHFVCVLICLVLEFSCSSAMHVTARCGPISPKLQNPKKCVPVKSSTHRIMPCPKVSSWRVKAPTNTRGTKTHIFKHTHTLLQPLFSSFSPICSISEMHCATLPSGSISHSEIQPPPQCWHYMSMFLVCV